MPIVGGGTLVGGKYQSFEHPTYPQFSAYAPDGLGAGENIRITHFVYDNDPNKSNEELAKLQSTVWVALLVPFAGDNIQYGIPIAGKLTAAFEKQLSLMFELRFRRRS